jgi:hypothetical protein
MIHSGFWHVLEQFVSLGSDQNGEIPSSFKPVCERKRLQCVTTCEAVQKKHQNQPGYYLA